MSSLLGSPADRAGCRAGDLLLSLNGLMVLFLSAEISLQLLEDMEDTVVTLQLERYNRVHGF
jgi:predicted metalloprotease with PDZ domain